MKKCINPLEICVHMTIRNGVYYCDSKKCVLHDEEIGGLMNKDIDEILGGIKCQEERK